MNAFVVGITGRVGSLLADRLKDCGDTVRGLVRHDRDHARFDAASIHAHLGDLGSMTPREVASAGTGADVIVFAAGSNSGARGVTEAIDRAGVVKTIEAANLAGIRRFALVSVPPEAWCERGLSADEEFYFAAKKEADVVLSHNDLDWLIVRPSLLTDEPGTGRIALGPAELHGQISRHDVAATLTALLGEPRVNRPILGLNEESGLINAAISKYVHSYVGPSRKL